MVSVNGNNKNNRVSVRPVTINNQVEATNNFAIYYSEISQHWAVGEGLLQNIDYSSKTYALQAKEYANNAKESMEITEEYMDNAISNIQTAETSALNNIVMQEESALSTVNQGVEQLNTTITEGVETIETLQANSIAEITTNKESALRDIDINKTNTLAQISTLANTSISDINAVGKSYDNLTYRNITNCLLEVPQRIKYDLTDGTLTIKAGSVVIVPYGTEDKTSELPVGATFLNDNFKVYDTQFLDGKFFVWAELVNDTTYTGDVSTDNNVRTLVLIISINAYNLQYNTGSGAGHTGSATNVLYYNTTKNMLEKYSTGGSLSDDNIRSLPLFLIQANGSNYIGSVNQVFNGMGYIGSTIWVDKGVKGLIPNGRNEDESLKNTEYTTDKLQVFTSTTANAKYNVGITTIYDTLALQQTKNYYELEYPVFPDVDTASSKAYVKSENMWYESNSGTDYKWSKLGQFICASVTWANGVISNFQPKYPFRAVDYNDKSEISGWGMPSSKYINLTLGASGSSYTAPANGWFCLSKQSNGANQQVEIGTGFNGLKNRCMVGATNSAAMTILPVKKGEKAYVVYNTGGVTNLFRFIYAEGEV